MDSIIITGKNIKEYNVSFFWISGTIEAESPKQAVEKAYELLKKEDNWDECIVQDMKGNEVLWSPGKDHMYSTE